MNLVEAWFSIIERQAIHRRTFGSVKQLNAKIRAFIDGWNERCHPFVWTKTAEQILTKANRQTTSNAGHWERSGPGCGSERQWPDPHAVGGKSRDGAGGEEDLQFG